MIVCAFFTFWKTFFMFLLCCEYGPPCYRDWRMIIIFFDSWFEEGCSNEIICQIKRPFFFCFFLSRGGSKKKKETHLIFSVCSHMKDHNKFLICLLRACGLSLLSQEDIDDPKCNKKDRQVFQLCLVKRLIMRIRDE